jgi:hypothetical protein
MQRNSGRNDDQPPGLVVPLRIAKVIGRSVHVLNYILSWRVQHLKKLLSVLVIVNEPLDNGTDASGKTRKLDGCGSSGHQIGYYVRRVYFPLLWVYILT